jgi:hypothetical protein
LTQVRQKTRNRGLRKICENKPTRLAGVLQGTRPGNYEHRSRYMHFNQRCWAESEERWIPYIQHCEECEQWANRTCTIKGHSPKSKCSLLADLGNRRYLASCPVRDSIGRTCCDRRICTHEFYEHQEVACIEENCEEHQEMKIRNQKCWTAGVVPGLMGLEMDDEASATWSMLYDFKSLSMLATSSLHLISQRKKHFNISGGEGLQWFLGIEIHRDRSQKLIWLSQSSYKRQET